MDIDIRLAAYCEALRELGADHYFLSELSFCSASAAQLNQIEQSCGERLEPSLRALLLANRQCLQLLEGYRLLSPAEILECVDRRERDEHSGLLEQKLQELISEDDGRWDDECFKRSFWHRSWIPIARTDIGDTLCVDLSPEPVGSVGQLIEIEGDAGPFLSIFHDIHSVFECIEQMLDLELFQVKNAEIEFEELPGELRRLLIMKS